MNDLALKKTPRLKTKVSANPPAGELPTLFRYQPTV